MIASLRDHRLVRSIERTREVFATGVHCAHGRVRIALRRVVLSGIAGLIAGTIVLVVNGSWSVSVSIGWDAAAVVFLSSTWGVLRKGAKATRVAARKEDASRAAADTVLLAASVASLISVGFVLVGAANRSGLVRGGYIALAVLSVAGAWLVVHSIYMLRYARLYYGDPIGGISFHADDQPDYRDFAYVALTIGMTFQVSDTDLTAKPIRRTAIQHALISYLFGVVIVAIMINIVGSLAST
jgi:uncharacterized membrane protein